MPLGGNINDFFVNLELFFIVLVANLRPQSRELEVRTRGHTQGNLRSISLLMAATRQTNVKA